MKDFSWANFDNSLKLNEFNVYIWKSIFKCNEVLSGDITKGDLDLYVPIENKSKLEKVLRSFNFIRCDSYVSSFHNVEHFILLQKTGCVHIHVYYEIVTGESNTKNFIFPVPEKFLTYSDPVFSFSNIRKLGKCHYESLFLIRYAIKNSSLYGLLLSFRDRDKYRNEICYLSEECQVERYLGLDRCSFENIKKIALSNNISVNDFFYLVSIKRKLSKYSKLGCFRHGVFKIKDVVFRVFNKLVSRRKKVISRGAVISVCGLDGSGKSTAVNFLKGLVSKKLTAEIVSMGRPTPTLFTFPFWIVFRVLEIFKHKSKDEKKPIEHYFPKDKISLLHAIRYWLLSIERLSASKKCAKFVSQGKVIITDRYPTTNFGKMDSPRIPVDINASHLYRLLSRLEKDNYKQILPSDLTLHLKTTVDIAVQRNALRNKVMKETDNEIIARFIVNDDICFNTVKYVMIDANNDLEFVRGELVDSVSSYLSSLSFNFHE
ncbi:hypothetical protein M2G93_13250 [Vibrio vulnificus]|uniref:hypothetical protein n=1 Tax=Vibrio vulnificus TaxID=672 RepID=UPI0002F42FBB|nr:hypothetical protein [Vibrio vulnificus]EGQ7950903.1 hypothetical protein [Vibrio vulnificus]EGQ7984130.1 hypothetical protein [Vibrio vulnificus]MCU8149076.1 hypothetical protein [Vibrio vulnificus]RZR38732.1 hypothetical protein D8T59_10370 [Vibrio vulnificus]HAS8110978.1 hypothetical protein [Vibrio vulnificus]